MLHIYLKYQNNFSVNAYDNIENKYEFKFNNIVYFTIARFFKETVIITFNTNHSLDKLNLKNIELIFIVLETEYLNH